jgi:Protein of unknown function (DUF3761)
VSSIATKLRVAVLAGLLVTAGCGPLDTPAAPQPPATTVSVPAADSPVPTAAPSPTPAAAAPATTGPAAPTQAATGGGGGGTGGACASDEYRNSDGNCVPRPVQADAPPPGATAQCNDGTYSFSQHRSGTCSHHGGVRRWL